MSYSPVCIFFLQPPTLAIYSCLLFTFYSKYSSSNVTAGGSQYVICAKYQIHKTFNQQFQPRGYNSRVLHKPSVEHYPHHTISCPVATSPYSTWNALALTRSPKGVAVHKLLLHSKCLGCGFEAEISCVWSVLRQSKGTPWVILLRHYLRR